MRHSSSHPATSSRRTPAVLLPLATLKLAVAAAPRPHCCCRQPPLLMFSASSSSSSPGPPDINAWFSSTTPCPPLEPFVGPVVPYRLKGVGLALEAYTTLQPGETLLVSRPLALLQRSSASNEDDGDDSGSWLVPLDEEIEALADQLEAASGGGDGSSSSSRMQAWQQHLDDGSLEHAQSASLPDLAALITAAAPATTPTAAALSSDSNERLLDIADVNARVLVQDELLLAEGLGGAADSDTASVGIWPELGLLRHSCSPNTTVLLHQTCAVVTASRGVPKHAPLHQNLLAAEVFAPLQHRRTLLRNLRGPGDCACPRCRDEAKQDPQLLQLVADIHEACIQQVGPELQQAVEADDEAALERLRDELAAFCEVVDAGFSKLGVRQQSQVWLQASLLRMYELAALVSAALGSPDAQLLQLLAALAAEVAPGSREHLVWALQFRSEVAADEDAAFDGALASADKRCVTALQLRYGRRLSQQKCRELIMGAEL